MAAITPTNTYRESMGSLTLLITQMTVTTNSDTYTIQANAPVVDFWSQAESGNGSNGPDITWTPSTGVFALTSGTIVAGKITLFILQRT